MSEAETYARELGWLLARSVDILGSLPEDRLRWRPATREANGAATMVTHLVGSTRAYALGLGCGRAVGRDRGAEFRAGEATSHELIAALEELAAEVDDVLGSLDGSTLDLPRDDHASRSGPLLRAPRVPTGRAALPGEVALSPLGSAP